MQSTMLLHVRLFVCVSVTTMIFSICLLLLNLKSIIILGLIELAQHKKVPIHQLTTMLSTSKNVQFPGHNHLLTTGADNLTL